jgi:hypothetical protein
MKRREYKSRCINCGDLRAKLYMYNKNEQFRLTAWEVHQEDAELTPCIIQQVNLTIYWKTQYYVVMGTYYRQIITCINFKRKQATKADRLRLNSSRT